MTVHEIVEAIKKECGVGKYGTNNPSAYLAGATNNRVRRKKEHHVSQLFCLYDMFTKEAAQDVLKLLADVGFDIGAEPGNGQDDSKLIYVYKKSLFSVEELEKEVTLDFGTKCFDEDHYDQLPDTEGIYVCLACYVNNISQYETKRKPVYIGMTEKQGFKTRIDQHVKQDHKKWEKHYDTKTEHLVYVIAEDDSDILQTIESALIYKNQPLANSEYLDHYQGEYARITVNCEGGIGTLKNSVTAKCDKK